MWLCLVCCCRGCVTIDSYYKRKYRSLTCYKLLLQRTIILSDWWGEMFELRSMILLILNCSPFDGFVIFILFWFDLLCDVVSLSLFLFLITSSVPFFPFFFFHFLWASYSIRLWRILTIYIIWYNCIHLLSAVLIYYMLGSVLYQQSIALIEIELLFISHALWYGALVAVNTPGSGLLSFVLCTPHTYLCLGVIGTAYDLPRPICLVCSVGILLFGGYRRYYQIPTHWVDQLPTYDRRHRHPIIGFRGYK